METRYYSESGGPARAPQLALHASRRVFDKITSHLNRKERVRQEIEKEINHKKYLKEATKAMTDNWENSVDNLRKKKEEARQQRLAQKADDRVEQYFKVLKWQADDRKKYVEEVYHKKFITTGAQKAINSGILISEDFHENQKNIELKNKEKERQRQDWKEFEDRLIQEDKDFKEKTRAEKHSRRMRAIENQSFIKDQISQKQEIEHEELKSKLEIEKDDIERQQKERDLIKKNATEDFIRAKTRSLEILKKSREDANKARQINEETDREMEKVSEIFRDAKRKIQCDREAFRKKEIQKVIDRQEGACKKLMEIQSQIISKEDEIIANAVAKQQEAELNKKLQKEVYDNTLREERKINYENALKERDQKRIRDKEVCKWEMLNRIKLMEITQDEEKRRAENKKNEMRKFAGQLDEQVEGNNKLKAEREAKEKAFKWNNFPEMDSNFLEYAEKELAQRKTAGKMTYPIERTIMEYKKKHGLVLPKKHPTMATQEGKDGRKGNLPKINRRICPSKNDSTSIRDCFCIDP